MPRKGSIIAAAPMVELIRKAGAERVSDEASRALAALLMDIGLRVSAEAIKLARHAGRKTVKAEDIELAKRVI